MTTNSTTEASFSTPKPPPTPMGVEEELNAARHAASLTAARCRIAALQDVLHLRQTELRHLLSQHQQQTLRNQTLEAHVGGESAPTHAREPPQSPADARRDAATSLRKMAQVRARLAKQVEVEECTLELAHEAARRALAKKTPTPARTPPVPCRPVHEPPSAQQPRREASRSPLPPREPPRQAEGSQPKGRNEARELVEKATRERREAWRQEKQQEYEQQSRTALELKAKAAREAATALRQRRAELLAAAAKSREEVEMRTTQERNATAAALKAERAHLAAATRCLSAAYTASTKAASLESRQSVSAESHALRMIIGANSSHLRALSQGEKAAAALIAAARAKRDVKAASQNGGRAAATGAPLRVRSTSERVGR